jgi:hypothetical protein
MAYSKVIKSNLSIFKRGWVMGNYSLIVLSLSMCFLRTVYAAAASENEAPFASQTDIHEKLRKLYTLMLKYGYYKNQKDYQKNTILDEFNEVEPFFLSYQFSGVLKSEVDALIRERNEYGEILIELYMFCQHRMIVTQCSLNEVCGYLEHFLSEKSNNLKGSIFIYNDKKEPIIISTQDLDFLEKYSARRDSSIYNNPEIFHQFELEKLPPGHHRHHAGDFSILALIKKVE